MSPKHTPGPWRAWPYATGEGDEAAVTYGVEATGCVGVATVTHLGDETAPNAHLIAAAPDLLAACRALLARVEHLSFDFTDARDAIAKAEGR